MSSPNSAVLPFDPDAAELPEGLPVPNEDGGEVVVLLADPATRESGWAPMAAVALARGWAGAGRRVFLMDCHPGEPTLHALLGEPNGEGVSDAVLYGVSPSRIGRTNANGFLFAAAGTAVADPGSVLRHPRWSSVLSACREAGSVVLLYLPAGVPGVDHLVAEGDRTIRLRTAAGAEGTHEPGVVSLRPVRSTRDGSAPRGEGVGAGHAEGAGGRTEDLPARPRQPSEPAAVPSSGAERTARKGKKTSSKRRISPWLLIVLLAVLALAVAVGLGLVQLPGVAGEPLPAALALVGAP
jgi:hypothetical protein